MSNVYIRDKKGAVKAPSDSLSFQYRIIMYFGLKRVILLLSPKRREVQPHLCGGGFLDILYNANFMKAVTTQSVISCSHVCLCLLILNDSSM